MPDAGGIDATLDAALRRWSADRPGAPALVPGNGNPVSFADLVARIDLLAAAFDDLPLAPAARIAVACEDQLDVAVAVLAAAATATAAPLDHDLPDHALGDALRTLGPDAIVVSPSVAGRVAALAPGIPLLVPSLGGASGAPRRARPPRAADDLAVVLPTSGSSGRPKWVKVSHRNFATSASIARERLGLEPDDRGLPLSSFGHVMGIRTLVDALWLGSAVIITPAPYRDLDGAARETACRTAAPTYLVGAPALLEAVAGAFASGRMSGPPPPSLRFARTGAAPLTPATRARIERGLGVPVVGAYGMTEAAKIACHDVPPDPSKADTVGRPTTDLRIVGGEVQIRGPGVTPGYVDATGDADAFTPDGWFRTGDAGTLDGDGFLALHGRLDDVINRGGELIAPALVEQAVAGHPSVAGALAFPMVHPSLGQDVGVLITAQAGGEAPGPQELRRWLHDRLPVSHHPSRVVCVGALPTTGTGKPDRRAAAAVASAARPHNDDAIVPAGAVEPSPRSLAAVRALWCEVLGVDPSGPADPSIGPLADSTGWFAAGGNSLGAVELAVRLGDHAGVGLPIGLVLDKPTIREQAVLLDAIGTSPDGPAVQHVVELVPGRPPAPAPRHALPPIVLVAGTDGTMLSLRRVARELGARLSDGRAVYGIESPWDRVAPMLDVGELAAHHAATLRAEGIDGAHLMGYSFGGNVVLQMSVLLAEAGCPPASVTMIDTMAPEIREQYVFIPDARARLAIMGSGVYRRWRGVAEAWSRARRGAGPATRAQRFVRELRAFPGGWRRGRTTREQLSPAAFDARQVDRARRHHLPLHEPVAPPSSVPVALVVTSVRARQCGDPALGWSSRLPAIRCHPIRATHNNLRQWRAGALAGVLLHAVSDVEQP